MISSKYINISIYPLELYWFVLVHHPGLAARDRIIRICVGQPIFFPLVMSNPRYTKIYKFKFSFRIFWMVTPEKNTGGKM